MGAERQRLVVVGGGIAGTAAAWAAARALGDAGRGDVEVLLLEEAAELGGKARTLERGGFRVEAGPNGYLDAGGELDELVEGAGLEKLSADAAAARRYLVSGGRPVELRPRPLAFARSGVLPFPSLLRLLAEPFVPRKGDGRDESVFDFAARRLGRGFAERLVQPMVAGIFAGDARALSLPAAFPRLARMEREHGSLVRALLARRRGGGAPRGGPAGPAGTLTSFAGGLQELPRGLALRGGFCSRTLARVAELSFDGGARRWRAALAGEGEAVAADALVLAIPAHAAAELLEPHAPRAARELALIDYPPVVVVGLGYGPEALARVPNGFGTLVPAGQGYRVIGVLFESRIFAGRSPEGTLLVRAMLGGALDREAGALPEDELARIARADVARLFGLASPPRLEEVVRWGRAIPQYALGHASRLSAIEAERAELARARPGLFLAGNWAGGVAFARAAAGGVAAGQEAARELLARPAPARRP